MKLKGAGAPSVGLSVLQTNLRGLAVDTQKANEDEEGETGWSRRWTLSVRLSVFQTNLGALSGLYSYAYTVWEREREREMERDFMVRERYTD